MRKVVIVNAHWSNRGDEAALRPILDELLKDKENAVSVIFKDKKQVQDFTYTNVRNFSAQFLPKNLNVILDCINKLSNLDIEDGLKNTVEELRDADLIIYSPGGAVISSNFWWVKQLEYLTPFVCAKELGIPIVVAAPSMGPFEQGDEKNQVLRLYLEYSKRLIVREKISENYLKNIGVVAETTVDTAFFDEPVEDKSIFDKNIELKGFFEKHAKVVAMTLSDFAWSVPLKGKESAIKQNEILMKRFIAKLEGEGFGILLIPQLFGNQNDKEYLNTYLQNNTFLLDESYDTYAQQYIVSRCYALIGMRYHSNIFAAKMGIPFIAIGYEEKMFGFMRDNGLEEYLLFIDKLSDDALGEKWETLISNYDKYKNELIERRKWWADKASITVDAVKAD